MVGNKFVKFDSIFPLYRIGWSFLVLVSFLVAPFPSCLVFARALRVFSLALRLLRVVLHFVDPAASVLLPSTTRGSLHHGRVDVDHRGRSAPGGGRRGAPARHGGRGKRAPGQRDAPTRRWRAAHRRTARDIRIVTRVTRLARCVASGGLDARTASHQEAARTGPSSRTHGG